MGKTLNAQRSQGETLYAHRSGSQGKQQGSSPHTPAVQGGAREPSTSRCVLSQPAVALPAAWRWRWPGPWSRPRRDGSSEEAVKVECVVAEEEAVEGCGFPTRGSDHRPPLAGDACELGGGGLRLSRAGVSASRSELSPRPTPAAPTPNENLSTLPSPSMLLSPPPSSSPSPSSSRSLNPGGG
eukprot:scaffold19581_cov22-Tisochrysis_lutea.AAC.2